MKINQKFKQTVFRNGEQHHTEMLECLKPFDVYPDPDEAIFNKLDHGGRLSLNVSKDCYPEHVWSSSPEVTWKTVITPIES